VLALSSQYVNNKTGTTGNTVDHSCNQRCYGNTTHSLYIADLPINNKNMKILCDEQQCFYGEFMTPATIKYTEVFVQIARYFASF